MWIDCLLQDSVNIRSDLDEKTRATAMLCYGYVTMYAPCDLIVSRLEAVIARVILPQFELVKVCDNVCPHTIHLPSYNYMDLW